MLTKQHSEKIILLGKRRSGGGGGGGGDNLFLSKSFLVFIWFIFYLPSVTRLNTEG